MGNNQEAEIEFSTVVPAKAGTHDHRLRNIGPRFRGDDNLMGRMFPT
jgi:hypothetical protein